MPKNYALVCGRRAAKKRKSVCEIVWCQFECFWHCIATRETFFGRRRRINRINNSISSNTPTSWKSIKQQKSKKEENFGWNSQSSRATADYCEQWQKKLACLEAVQSACVHSARISHTTKSIISTFNAWTLSFGVYPKFPQIYVA